MSPLERDDCLTRAAGMPPKPPDIMSDDRILLAWQRSHMANERTFLAWSRTSISLLAFGFVIERFDLFMKYLFRLPNTGANGVTSPVIAYLCLLAFLLAGVTIVVSGLRFLRVRRHINCGEASFSIMPDVLVSVSVLVIIIMTVLLAVPQFFR